MISHSTIDSVHSLPVLDVVSKFYRHKLKPVGSSGPYRGLSPFTDERTPSFYVVPKKNIFKDFSSGNGGGAVHFVMLHENLSYPLAIKAIAREFGIEVEEDEQKQDPKEVDHIEQLHKLNRRTSRTYQELFWEMRANAPAFPHVFAEIDRRKFTADTLVQWQIGYAPDEWSYLSGKLNETGLTAEAQELGLIKHNQKGSHYDFFRHRLIFPVHDHRGHVVAFGGRHLPGATHAEEADRPIKYLNSSESKIFQKSKVLYGLHFAMHAIREQGRARLVEGYTDVISMHQAGFENTVGSCGTSLTEDQAQLLKRYTNHVVLVYDGDKAGANAMDRCIDILYGEGFQIDICPLPEGKDPDDFVREFKTEVAFVDSDTP